jgi:hypothetical protein
MLLTRRVPWTQQPQGVTRPNNASGVGIGLRRVIHPLFNTICQVSGLPVTTQSGIVPTTLQADPKFGVAIFKTTGDNGTAQVAAWTNTTSQASAMLVFQRNSSSDQGFWELTNSGSFDHFPYGGVAYFGSFWSGRWISGLSAPSGAAFTDRVVIIVTVKDGEQKLYWNGQLWGSASATGGFVMPPTLGFWGVGAGDSAQGTRYYLGAAWDRVLNSDEAFILGSNPWQIFAPTVRRILVGGGGTISRPGTDVAVSGWTSTAASIAGAINESTYDDASYAEAPFGVAGAVVTLDLPLAPGNYTVSFRGEYLIAMAGSGQFRFTAMDSSNTNLGVSAWQAVTSSLAQYDIPVTVAGGTATRMKIEIQA